MPDDGVRITEIAADRVRVRIAAQQAAALLHRDRVDVDIHHPRRGLNLLRHLVHIAQSRDPRADVQELGDVLLLDQPSHRPPQVGTIRPGHQVRVRELLLDLMPERPVDGEVVHAAQRIVVHP